MANAGTKKVGSWKEVHEHLAKLQEQERAATIQIEDIIVTKRWKTVEDSLDGFGRITTMWDACEARDKVRLEMDEDERKQVKLRIKRHLGFYFIQARLETR